MSTSDKLSSRKQTGQDSFAVPDAPPAPDAAEIKRLRLENARLRTALNESGRARIFADGALAAAQVAESVKAHCTWGLNATPDDGLRLGIESVAKPVRQFADLMTEQAVTAQIDRSQAMPEGWQDKDGSPHPDRVTAAAKGIAFRMGRSWDNAPPRPDTYSQSWFREVACWALSESDAVALVTASGKSPSRKPEALGETTWPHGQPPKSSGEIAHA